MLHSASSCDYLAIAIIIILQSGQSVYIVTKDYLNSSCDYRAIEIIIILQSGQSVYIVTKDYFNKIP